MLTLLSSQSPVITVQWLFFTLSAPFNELCENDFQLPPLVAIHDLCDLLKCLPILLH
jgi:hypothetical protein